METRIKNKFEELIKEELFHEPHHIKNVLTIYQQTLKGILQSIQASTYDNSIMDTNIQEIAKENNITL